MVTFKSWRQSLLSAVPVQPATAVCVCVWDAGNSLFNEGELEGLCLVFICPAGKVAGNGYLCVCVCVCVLCLGSPLYTLQDF